MRLRGGALPLLALVLAGCAPVVSHPARVEPGPGFGVRAGGDLAALAQDVDSEYFFPVSATFNVQYGVRPWGEEGAALLLGVGVPAFAVLGPRLAVLSDADLYVQFPGAREGLQKGAGVLASLYHVMPYAQVGREGAGGAGWHVTNGVAFVPEIEPNDDFSRGRGLFWLPAYTRYDAGRNVTVSAYASGALGFEEGERCTFDPYRCRRERSFRWALLLGVGMDVHGRRRAGGE